MSSDRVSKFRGRTSDAKASEVDAPKAASSDEAVPNDADILDAFSARLGAFEIELLQHRAASDERNELVLGLLARVEALELENAALKEQVSAEKAAPLTGEEVLRAAAADPGFEVEVIEDFVRAGAGLRFPKGQILATSNHPKLDQLVRSGLRVRPARPLSAQIIEFERTAARARSAREAADAASSKLTAAAREVR